MNNTNEIPRTSLFRILGIGFSCFIIMFAGIQGILVKPENQILIANALQGVKTGLCEKGIRTPVYKCDQQAGFIKEGSHHPELNTAERLAYLPDVVSVMNKLYLPDNSSASAAKFITLVGLLQESRQHDSSGAYKALGNIADKLGPVWGEYPQLVVAKTCIFCGSYTSNIIRKLGVRKNQNLKAITTMAKLHPLLFASVYPHLDKAEAQEAAMQLALLKGAGSSYSATAIGKHLNTGMAEHYLNAWVSQGLNGTRALDDLDLNLVPLETRIQAWQSGILLGYDNIELTQHLTAKGYRPALRWLVWLQGTPLKYLQGWPHERNSAKYNALLEQHTNFGHLGGNALAMFYSDNWSSIFWDDQQHRWIANR
jgi:hypothetical protein